MHNRYVRDRRAPRSRWETAQLVLGWAAVAAMLATGYLLWVAIDFAL